MSTSHTATFLGSKVSGSGASQRLYRLDPPIRGHWVPDEGTEAAEQHQYVIVSAVSVPYSGPETYIFPADADGNIVDLDELSGSFRGGVRTGSFKSFKVNS